MAILREEVFCEGYSILSWQEYALGLDLSHWTWNSGLDREVEELEDGYVAYPVCSQDIYEEEGTTVETLKDNVIAISWSNFRNDGALIKDSGNELLGYLLLKELEERRYKVEDGCPSIFESVEEIKEYLKEQKEEEKV